jgi:oligopeptide transport system permease protein
LLGTDSLGRDMLTRLMYGARISLTVAFIAAFINLVIGILYGGVSGYLGGNVDNAMMRVVDVISTIPLTLYVILIMVILDSGFLSIIVALSSVYWVSMARVVRGQIMALKEQEFVLAARTIGTSPMGIVLRHLLPNCMGPIIVTATMLIPTAIFVESFMSFIGLGVSAPMASWGTMCNDALETMKSTPHQLFAPAIAICITMFSFNFIGDGLRDALDPKSRK